MRDLFFRGKTIESGEWKTGNYLFCVGKHYIHLGTTTGKSYEVYPETVGQWTGLIDVKYKWIFDGDVIETVDVPNPKWYEVIFDLRNDSRDLSDSTQSAGFCLKEVATREYMCFLQSKKMKVIGNIYDDLETLEHGSRSK
jgi:uncharacterized phage protein (TIGR01671 family)